MSRMTSTKARIKLRRMLTATENNLKPTMKQAADDLRDEMKAHAPRDTGDMVDLITSFVAKNGLRAEAGFRGKKAKREAFYARFIEFGTKSHTIGLKNREVLSGQSGTFGTSADHPGIPADPFISKAWDTQKPKIQKATAKAINDAIKKAQNV